MNGRKRFVRWVTVVRAILPVLCATPRFVLDQSFAAGNSWNPISSITPLAMAVR
jgi:hypothetical protein